MNDKLLKLCLQYKDKMPKRIPLTEQETFNMGIIHYKSLGINVINIRNLIWLVLNDIKSIPTCECGKQTNWNVAKKQYNKFCSNRCARLSEVTKSKTKKTLSCIDKKAILIKRQNTNREKYGHTNFLVSSLGREKIKQSFALQNVTNPSQLPYVQQLKIQRSLEKYGVPHPSQTDEVKNKIKITNEIRYGKQYWSQQHIPNESLALLNDKNWLHTQHIVNKKSIPIIAEELGIWDTTVINYLRKHGITPIKYYSSIGQHQIVEFLKSLGVENITINNRTMIYPIELDIFLPDYNLAIEYNGLYWHSEAAGKDARYHLKKTEACESKGIRLIQIFEDEWFNMQQQCKDTLRHLLNKSPKGVYARNVTIKEIEWNIAQDFLNKHHLLGAGSPGSYRIGAYTNSGELIGVMVFGKSSSEGTNELELKRFVTNKQNNPGLGSKMFKYATKQLQCEKVVAFVDRRWFTGLVKDHIGFKKLYTTPPAVWWTDGKQRKHRRFITKKQLIAASSLNNGSKRAMLANSGFFRIWDCGKIKLVWENPNL
jgi:hypothetical protein